MLQFFPLSFILKRIFLILSWVAEYLSYILKLKLAKTFLTSLISAYNNYILPKWAILVNQSRKTITKESAKFKITNVTPQEAFKREWITLCTLSLQQYFYTWYNNLLEYSHPKNNLTIYALKISAWFKNFSCSLKKVTRKATCNLWRSGQLVTKV